MAHIGILGGTFDPPHNGHLALADTAIGRLGLEKVVFVPARLQPHKRDRRMSSAEDRMAMVRLAIAGKDQYQVSAVEFKRPGPSYTVDTLRELKSAYAGAELYFLIGADNIPEMESWHEPEEIFKLGTVAAAKRPGFAVEGKFANSVVTFDMEPVDISSTLIRQRVKFGASISGLVPPAVEAYILDHNLYKDNGQADSD